MLKPAIVQDAATGRVLMLAWQDEEAERLTRETGEAWFWSRSRQKLWRKGETSGNTLAVVELRDDCDGDAVLLRVEPAGAACHTGSVSCFAPELWRTISERAMTRPDGSYTSELLEAGLGACARKVGEEAVQRSTRATIASWRKPPISSTTSMCCWPPAASMSRSWTTSCVVAHSDFALVRRLLYSLK